MLVDRRLTNKFDFRCLKGILIIKPEMQSEPFPRVQSIFGTLEFNVPDRFHLIDYVKLEYPAEIIVNVFHFLLESFTYIHFYTLIIKNY